jgi:hypothetical protein
VWCGVDELLHDTGGVRCKARGTSKEALANSHHSAPMRVTVLRIRVQSVAWLTSHVLGASDLRVRCGER